MSKTPLPPTYISSKDIPFTSSNVDVNLVFTIFMSVFAGDETEPDPLNRLDWLDPLDCRLHRALDATPTIGTFFYNAQLPLTTLAMALFRTTSPFWLIAIHNGYNHPDEIPGGVTLEIPDVEVFKTVFKGAKKQIKTPVTF